MAVAEPGFSTEQDPRRRRGDSSVVLGHLQALYDVGTLTGLSDRELLERFQAAHQDGDRAAAQWVLAALIERHAPMVWGVCRALIRDPHDAEDAFQATFLILVRKASSLRIRETLGSWLHVVAYRTGLSIRSAAARRRTIERAAARSRSEASESPGADDGENLSDDDRAIIHAEIARLPDPVRAVVVLCDIEGLSYRQASRRLNLPLGTIQSRLARARRRLRKSLIRQGIGMPASSRPGDSLPDALPALLGAGGIPRSLTGRVGRLCGAVAVDPSCTGTVLTGSVQSLIQRGLRSMFLGNMKRVLVSLAGGVLVCGTFWHSVARSGQPCQADPQPASRPEPQQHVEKGPIRKGFTFPAPRRVKAAAGQGRILIYALDEQGERIREQVKKKNRNRGGPMGGMGLAGRAKKKFRTETVFREETREIRWAVVTGIIDHRRVQWWYRDGGRRVLKPARVVYRRVELERKTLEEDGSWSEWQAVDMEANIKILDNLPVVEEERALEEFRVENLVDPLPVLKAGRWSGVDVESFVPTQAEPAEAPQSGLFEVPRELRPAATPPEAESPVLMLRTLDFTVEAGRTYRYRSRVVVFNPDYQRGEKRPAQIFGPWSEATAIVTVP